MIDPGQMERDFLSLVRNETRQKGPDGLKNFHLFSRGETALNEVEGSGTFT